MKPQEIKLNGIEIKEMTRLNLESRKYCDFAILLWDGRVEQDIKIDDKLNFIYSETKVGQRLVDLDNQKILVDLEKFENFRKIKKC